MAAAFRAARSLAVAAVAAGFVHAALAQQQPQQQSPQPDSGTPPPAAPTAGGSAGGQAWRPFPTMQVTAPVSTAAAAAPPETAPPAFQSALSAEVKESWTDNVALTSTHQRHDEISSISPAINLSARGYSTDLEVGYNGGYDRYVNNTEFDSFQHNGVATLASSWLDQRATFTAQGSVSEPNINPTSAVAGGNRANPVNRLRNLSYNAGPKFQEPLGDFAVVSVSGTHSQTVNERINSVETAQNTPAAAPAIGDTTENRAHAEAHGGIEFSRLLWDLTSDVSRSRLSTGALAQQSDQLATEYKVTRDFGVLIGGGYDYFHGLGVSASNNGGSYYGGVHWTPSPNTDLRIGGGWREGKPYFFGLLNEQLGPYTNLRISRDTKITSDSLNTFDTLESLVRSIDGSTFVDPLTGLAASPGSTAFQQSNSVYRLSTTQAVLTRTEDRDSLSLTVLVSSQDVLSNQQSNLSVFTGAPLAQANTTVTGNLQWTHQLSRVLTASLSGGINAIVASSLPTGKTKRAQATADLAYTLSDKTTLEAQYFFSDALVPSGSNIVSAFGSTSGRIKEDLVFVALKRKF